VISKGFIGVDIRDGDLLNGVLTNCGATIVGIQSLTAVMPAGTNTVLSVTGNVTVTDDHGSVMLSPGMYAVVPSTCTIEPVSGLAVTICFPEAHGFRQFGGPLEAEGRLTYIDGCTDTLLVCPPRLGAPCLNHLHIPAGTDQSFHTHPSDRLGVILNGSGWCDTPDGSLALSPGLAWYIRAGYEHRFRTETNSLDVIAWHPDSDFGPTDDNHPMINRTILDRDE
jgi:mannose-6-phosphate isomerase-like protein (cupin superfamily)